jgi:L-threonylcarbamoyladenylate synthase
MELLRVDPSDPDPNAIARAAAVIRRGGLVAFPTETVYGLGAHALDPRAVERIYEAKGRPSYNPIIVHVASAERARDVVREWNEYAERLAGAFWPGPMTLVLAKRPDVPDAVTAGLPTVGVRVPAHPVARALLEAADVPIAAPSANRSMQLSPTMASHVVASLGDAADVILDGGPTWVGIESTVIDVTGDQLAVLRPGTITLEQIGMVTGAPATIGASAAGDAARPSPGMLDRHYAPRARVVLVEASDVGIRVELERARGYRTGAVVITASVEAGPDVERLPADPAIYASRLYATLHALDDAGCDIVVVERVPDSGAWLGVRDRLERAAR